MIHGMSKGSFYAKWNSMHNRCENPAQERYPRYGGRGIKVSENWRDFLPFRDDMYESYLFHVKKYGSENTTLDRINVDGDYCKENCRWATRSEQAFNRGPRNIKPRTFLTFKGKKQSVIAWADELGIKRTTLFMRIHSYGWSVKRALSTK